MRFPCLYGGCLSGRSIYYEFIKGVHMMKNQKFLGKAVLFTSIFTVGLAMAQDEAKAPKVKRHNLTGEIMDIVKGHDGLDDFRVFVSSPIINTGVNVISDTQEVDTVVHKEFSGEQVGERTKKDVPGKIISVNGDHLFVSFDRSCTTKSCSYHFEPNGRGDYILTKSPDQGNKAMVPMLRL